MIFINTKKEQYGYFCRKNSTGATHPFKHDGPWFVNVETIVEMILFSTLVRRSTGNDSSACFYCKDNTSFILYSPKYNGYLDLSTYDLQLIQKRNKK